MLVNFSYGVMLSARLWQTDKHTSDEINIMKNKQINYIILDFYGYPGNTRRAYDSHLQIYFIRKRSGEVDS